MSAPVTDLLEHTSEGGLPLERSSGVLLHVSSLPGGRLGDEAYRFVDWLVAAGQSWWQVLPLHPPDALGSPYAPVSAFAGWSGLLAEPAEPVSREDISDLSARGGAWLEEWVAWAGEEERTTQARFQKEWIDLRAYANGRGVKLIGDLPLYVGGNSCDVDAHPELFDCSVTAGAAPDARHPNGQRWGMPVFCWDVIAEQGYDWWLRRLARELELFDLLRIDHIRGLVAFWVVPGDDPAQGYWRPGPGRELFAAAEQALGPPRLIVEDLGLITPDVIALRDELGLPGMSVFAREKEAFRRDTYSWATDTVLYTSTHDTDTLIGWWNSVGKELTRDIVPGGSDHDVNWALVDYAFQTDNPLVVVQAQDLLGLGSEARMNAPGTTGPHNWSWRLEQPLDDELARRLRQATARAGRLPADRSP